IIDVRAGGDEDREGLATVETERPAPAARADVVPPLDRKAGRGELRQALAEHDPPHAGHDVWQAAGAVGERGEIRVRIFGAEVQARPRIQVRFLERTYPDVAAGSQERVVRTDVEIDLVAGRAWWLAVHGRQVRSPNGLLR